MGSSGQTIPHRQAPELSHLGSPSWESVPKSHKPDASVWNIKGTSFEKMQVRMNAAGYRYNWFRNDMWILYNHKHNKGFEATYGRHIIPSFFLFVAIELGCQAYYSYTGKFNPHVYPMTYLLPPVVGGA